MKCTCIGIVFLVTFINFTPVFAGASYINTSLEEPSGIVFHPIRNTLYVVDDEGSIVEMDLSGNILNQREYKDYDLEGVALNTDRDTILVSQEGEDAVLIVDVVTLAILHVVPINRFWLGYELLYADDEYGVEGITLAKNSVYIVNQSYNTDSDQEKRDPSALIRLQDVNKDSVEAVMSMVTFIPFPDLAGVAYYNGFFYLISDDEDLLLVYDLDKNEIIRWYDLPCPGDQEGITFDGLGTAYLAVDGQGVCRWDGLK